MSELMTIWPMMLVKTLRETRLAVGRLWWILGYGRVRPTADQQSSFATWPRTMRRGYQDSLATAIGMITNRSM